MSICDDRKQGYSYSEALHSYKQASFFELICNEGFNSVAT